MKIVECNICGRKADIRLLEKSPVMDDIYAHRRCIVRQQTVSGLASIVLKHGIDPENPEHRRRIERWMREGYARWIREDRNLPKFSDQLITDVINEARRIRNEQPRRRVTLCAKYDGQVIDPAKSATFRQLVERHGGVVAWIWCRFDGVHLAAFFYVDERTIDELVDEMLAAGFRGDDTDFVQPLGGTNH